MNATVPTRDPGSELPEVDQDVRLLFHRLNNQLGVSLAHAELLETKAGDEASRARAAQVVESLLQAMATAREIRRRSETTSL